ARIDGDRTVGDGADDRALVVAGPDTDRSAATTSAWGSAWRWRAAPVASSGLRLFTSRRTSAGRRSRRRWRLRALLGGARRARPGADAIEVDANNLSSRLDVTGRHPRLQAAASQFSSLQSGDFS